MSKQKTLIRCLCSLLCLLSTCLCAVLPGHVQFDGNVTSLDVQRTQIEITEVSSEPGSYRQRAFIHPDGTFELNNIPKGEFVLTVLSIDYNLIPFKARVIVNEDDEVHAYVLHATSQWDKLGQEIPLPIQIIPNPKQPLREYLVERTPGLLKSGPIATVLNNPLYLGAAILSLIAIAAPYLMEKFDPETAKAVREERAASRREKIKPSQAAIEATEKLQSSGNEVKAGSKSDSTLKKRRN